MNGDTKTASFLTVATKARPLTTTTGSTYTQVTESSSNGTVANQSTALWTSSVRTQRTSGSGLTGKPEL